MLVGLGREGEFQPPVNRVAELPNLGVGLWRFEGNGIVETAGVLHLKVLRAFQRVPFAVIHSVSPHGQLDMLREGIFEDEVMIAPDSPVSVARIVNVDVEQLLVGCVVYYHRDSYFF